MSTRARRLLAAEQVTGARRVGGVLRLLPGETAEEGVARAAAAGRTGGFLVVPPLLDADEWERETVAQQRAAAVEAELFTRDYLPKPAAPSPQRPDDPGLPTRRQ